MKTLYQGNLNYEFAYKRTTKESMVYGLVLAAQIIVATIIASPIVMFTIWAIN